MSRLGKELQRTNDDGQRTEADSPLQWVAGSDRRWRRDLVQLVASIAVFVAVVLSPVRSHVAVVVVVVVIAVIAWLGFAVALVSLAERAGPLGYPRPNRVAEPPAPPAPGAVHDIDTLGKGLLWSLRVVMCIVLVVCASVGVLFSTEVGQPASSGGGSQALGPAIIFWVLAALSGVLAIMLGRRDWGGRRGRRGVWLEGTVLNTRALGPARSADLARVSTAEVRARVVWSRYAAVTVWELQVRGDGRLKRVALIRGFGGMCSATDYRALAGALAANPNRAGVADAIDALLDFAEITDRIKAAGPRLRRPRNLATVAASLVVGAALIAGSAVWSHVYHAPVPSTASDPNGAFPSDVPLPNVPELYDDTAGETLAGQQLADMRAANVAAQTVTAYRNHLTSHGWKTICTGLTITTYDTTAGRKPGQPPLRLPATAYWSSSAHYVLMVAHAATGGGYLAIHGTPAAQPVACAALPHQL